MKDRFLLAFKLNEGILMSPSMFSLSLCRNVNKVSPSLKSVCRSIQENTDEGTKDGLVKYTVYKEILVLCS